MPVQTPDTPVKKPTAAQRRETRRLEEQQARQDKLDEFAKNKDQVWLALWAAALQLWLQLDKESELRSSHDWHFDDLHVDVNDGGSFRIRLDVFTKDTLTLDLAEKARDFLDVGAGYYADHMAAKKARLEALERERVRKEALTKLSAAEVAALGVSLRVGERELLRA